jgi:hypothetical protein
VRSCTASERERERERQRRQNVSGVRARANRLSAWQEQEEEGFYYIWSVLDGDLCVGDCTPKDEAIPVTRLMCGVDKEIGTY